MRDGVDGISQWNGGFHNGIAVAGTPALSASNTTGMENARGPITRYRVTSSASKFCCGDDGEWDTRDGTSGDHCCATNTQAKVYDPTTAVCCNGQQDFSTGTVAAKNTDDEDKFMTVAPGMDKCCGSTPGQQQAFLEGDQFCMLNHDNSAMVLTASVTSSRTLAHDWGYRIEAKPPD